MKKRKKARKLVLVCAVIAAVIAVIAAAIVLTVNLCRDRYSNKVSKEQKALRDKYVTSVDDVSIDMLDADYWIAKYKDADKIIMNADEIAEWNKKQESYRVKVESHENFQSLSGKETLDKEEMFYKLTGYDPVGAELYDEKGNLIDGSHWDTALKNRNTSAVKMSNPIHYGFVTQYSELKMLPTFERGYQDKDDILFDDFVNTSAVVCEPVIMLHESKDAKWVYVISTNAEGWMPTANVGRCESYDEWKSIMEEPFLLVTGERFSLPDEAGQENGGVEVSMGAKLPLVDPEESNEYLFQRKAQNSYIVKIPSRDSSGRLVFYKAYVPMYEDVNVGYLDYTSANVLRQAFKTLGSRYGWGGMFNARDCSALTMDVYRCFGIRIERNSSAQGGMNTDKIDFTDKTDKEKLKMLAKDAKPGQILFFPGHVFIYLGMDDGKAYTISSASSCKMNDPEGPKIYVQSTMVNSLDMYRPNGKTWLESLEKCICIP